MAIVTLEVEALSLSFSGLRALHNVSLRAEPGQLVAVVGPKGAGKTSLFDCISGVYTPQKGEVRFEGQRLTGLAPHRIPGKGIARMFQDLRLFENLTVLENLLIGRHHLYRTRFIHDLFWSGPARREEIRHRKCAEEIIEFMRLEQHRKTPVRVLPYGVRKRVGLARALCMEPKLLLLDEPSAGLSHEDWELMARYVLDIRSELNMTQIVVEHDLRFVMDLADRVFVLGFGENLSEGPPQFVSNDRRVVEAYLARGAVGAQT